MSVRVMSMVWEFSQAKGGDLLILLAIADHADDDGRAFPGEERLAKKGRMSERNVRHCLAGLQLIDELTVIHGRGKGHPNHYQVNLDRLLSRAKEEKITGKDYRKSFPLNDMLNDSIPSDAKEEKISGYEIIPDEIKPEKSDTKSGKGFPPNHHIIISTKTKKKNHRRASPKPDSIPEWSEELPWGNPTTLIALYHERKPDDWAAVETLSASRIKKCTEYLAQFPHQEFWEKVLVNLHQDGWLKQNLAQSLRSLDWLLQKGSKDGIENCVKVAEGKYRQANTPRASPPTDADSVSNPPGCIGFSWRDGKGRYCDACHATHFPVGR